MLIGSLRLGCCAAACGRPQSRRRQRIGVVGWNLTGELAAAAGTNSIAQQAATTLGRPFSWVDEHTHLLPTLYMGEAEVDQNPEWLLEFWNRSIARVSSLDGSVLGPGFSGGPNILRDGALYWQDLPDGLTTQYAYGVEDLPCIDLAGSPVKRHLFRAGGRMQAWELVRLAKPNRLRSTCTGIYADSWTGAKDSFYYRFSGPGGWLRVAYSRPENYPIPPTPVRITVGAMSIVDKQPALVARCRSAVDIHDRQSAGQGPRGCAFPPAASPCGSSSRIHSYRTSTTTRGQTPARHPAHLPIPPDANLALSVK